MALIFYKGGYNLLFAPLIHSRTYSVDFRPNFFAIPQDFNKGKIEWAKKFVLSSTKELEFTRNEIRKLIFSDGEHCIIGITCHMSTLSKICGEIIKETRDSTETREVYVFLGLTHKIDNNEGLVFDISPSTFLDIYKKYVIPKWLDKVASEPFPLPYSNYSVQESIKPFKLDAFSVKETSSGTRRALESNVESDEQLYKYTLSKVKIGQKISMCTKLSNLSSFAKSPFESATCLNINGNLSDILENQRLNEKTKFKADNSSVRRSSNTDNNLRPFGVNNSFSNNTYLDAIQSKSYDQKIMSENKDYELRSEYFGRGNYIKSSFGENNDKNSDVENINIASKSRSSFLNVTDKDNENNNKPQYSEIDAESHLNLIKETAAVLISGSLRSMAKLTNLDNAKDVIIDIFRKEDTNNSIAIESSLEQMCLKCPYRNISQKEVNRNKKKYQTEESEKESESNRIDLFDL